MSARQPITALVVTDDPPNAWHRTEARRIMLERVTADGYTRLHKLLYRGTETDSTGKTAHRFTAIAT